MFYNAVIFTVLMGFVFLVLLGVTAYKVGTIRGAIDYYRTNPEYRDWLPLLYIPAAIMFVLWVLAQPAQAEPVRTLEYTQIHAGIETPIGGASGFCRPQEDGVDNKLTSNLGMTQHIVGWHDIDIVGAYTHHSCAIDKDQNLWDGIGLHVRWTHYW